MERVNTPHKGHVLDGGWGGQGALTQQRAMYLRRE